MTPELQKKIDLQDELIQQVQKLELEFFTLSKRGPESEQLVRQVNELYYRISSVFQSKEMQRLAEQIRETKDPLKKEELWKQFEAEKEHFYKEENLNL